VKKAERIEQRAQRKNENSKYEARNPCLRQAGETSTNAQNSNVQKKKFRILIFEF
jgi:hypothetical protein